ncbi:BACON domain-containing carbohydrate-binding protein [Segatella copri]|uniref:BACON domain-containing protein n=1 Tax=Segatella copri TaxID=165179 RepID=UPI002939A2FD|nr:BACON domain-containing carbohydrate-binding protein [Segatella copri]MDV3106649.1 BACON domain-containing carbohydrate-binding protein [Segatella copri]
MKKIKHLMIWIGLLLSLVSCKDTMEAIGLGGDEIPAEGVVLNINLPNFSEKQLGTRADATETESINKLTLLYYDSSSKYLSKEDRTNQLTETNKLSNGSYNIKVNTPKEASYIQVVANADVSDEKASDLQDIGKAAERIPSLTEPVCWGSIKVTDLLTPETAKISLLRSNAKITLKVAEGIKGIFPEESAGLIINNTAKKTAIAPKDYKEPTDEGLATTTEFSSTNVGDGLSRVVAVNETSVGVANVIIMAKYKGKEGYKVGYYKVGLYNADKSSQYALLRNHNYTITVTKVNDYGFKTLDEAIKAKPENRIEAEIVDDNPAITRMIACKDYELGVCDDQSVNATAAIATEDVKATITLVTTLSSATSADGKLYGIEINSEDSWIKSNPQTSESEIPETKTSSSGKKYVLTFTLAQNIHETPRTGTVTISSGDLKLDVKITQAGFDFMRDDPKRKVIMYKDNNVSQEDYFAWLDKVNGINPEQMQGVLRNNGLHFTVGKNAYSYKIPKQDKDKLTVDNRTGDVLTDDKGHFTVSADGDYWKVTLKDDRDNNYDLWKGTFTITNAAGINITYTIYHTGIFHEITDYMANKYELTEGGDDKLKVTGMFYYGVVKVKGKAHTYIMLDRNLGATDNSPYVPDINEFKNNKGAIGGYFKISENKTSPDATKGNLSPELSPEGFEIPDRFVFEDLIANDTLKTEVRHTALGESYYCTFMNTTSSELKTIYLPYGGYLEGISHKNPVHVILWTKSLLSGTQGFGEDSPEFGYWYNYFDVYNEKKGISNIRFVSGSNGNNTGRYKAMPLRLISKTVL